MNTSLFAAVALFLLLSGVFWLAGYQFYVRPARTRARLGGNVMAGQALEPAIPISVRLAAMFNKMGKLLPIGRNAAAVRQNLTMAGYRAENAPQVFLGLRAAAVALLFASTVFVPIGAHSNPGLRMILMIGGAGIGWRIPGFLLKKRVAARQERLRLSLPDALDLIIIAVEAGLGLDQAIQHVAQELHGGEHGDLSEELQLIGMGMLAGMRRADALREFAERTGEDEIQKLVAILIQNDKFGTSMGEAMRSHSQYMRVQRRQQADERASKVGVKLVFPIFFFILPSMMLIAAGPGILQIFKYLFPMMKQLH
jgi:tight adherence protein C